MGIEIAGTSKLLKEFRVDRETLPGPVNEGLDLWYADLLYHTRRKCVMLRNPATGLAGFYLYVSRQQIMEIPQQWPRDLERILTTLLPGVEGSVLAASIPRDECHLRRTTDRGSLASLVNKREAFFWDLLASDPSLAEEKALQMAIGWASFAHGPKYSIPLQNLTKLACAMMVQ